MRDDLQAAIFWTNQLYKLGKNYLFREGWLNQKPIDGSGAPTPWFTYPAITFLKDIITRDQRVFEYGSGYGTLFFNACVNTCVSVEHDSQWANKLTKTNKNLQIIVQGEASHSAIEDDHILGGFLALALDSPISNNRNHNVEHGLLNQEFASYASQIARYDKGYFDIIVIDGMARNLCGFYAANLISNGGYIILDNSDRWQYNALQRYLVNSGFGRIDFWGPGPSNSWAWCTSFFSKNFRVKNTGVERPIGSGDLGW